MHRVEESNGARVLITGATGFVGSHVAETFVGAGYTVRCSVRTSSDTRNLSRLPVELVPLSLGAPEPMLARSLEGVEAVVHVAGLTRARREEDYYRVNAEGTSRLAGAAASAGVWRFVLIGSLAARGPDSLAGAGGDHPDSAYGRSKLEAERALRTFEDRMETVALRPAAVYGPGDTELLPLFKMASRRFLVLPSGENLLQPVYASDVARAALAAVRATVGFGPFPVAETSRYGWEEIRTGIEAALGHRVRTGRLPGTALLVAGRASEGVAKVLGREPVFDERRARDLALHSWTCDPAATRQKLGWRAEVPLHEGLERTTHWYRKEGWI